VERNIINELEREKRLIEGENSYQSLAREISPTPAASKGLIFLPYLKV
jgi:sugar (pentulose or hexulose) kinase